jgi:hypothetical protein
VKFAMRELTAGAVVLAFSSAGLAARADTPPLRHLVYSFSYESSQHGAVTNEPGSTGNRTYNGRLDDSGTIAVDVLREAPDRGLVVVVSEQGEYRKSVATTCAVYGNTDVVCDPTKPMNGEEYTLLRFLGANFYDPNLVDPKQHWSVSQRKSATTMSADYWIKSNDNGAMTIQETRHVEDTSQGSVTFDTETKLDYNANRLLPTSIDEYSTEEQHSGVIGTSTTTYQTTLKLVSDSMAKQ